MSRAEGIGPHYTDDNRHDTVTSMAYLIAEMACSHDGKLEHARRIAEAAGVAGADALQFQIWRAIDLMVPHHPDFAKLQALELPRQDWAELVAWTRARYPRMDLQACVYDPEALRFSLSLGIDLIKIHANEIGNYRLLELAARSVKRIDLCVGACRLDEIREAIDTIRAAGTAEIWLFYGMQVYPTPVEAIHLDYLRKLADLFELPVAYQDHCDAEDETAFWIPAAALGMGVKILEKHLTDDRSRKGADHHSALEPAEFARFARMVRSIDSAKGVGTPTAISELQQRYRAVGLRKLVAKELLPAGTRLTENNLVPLRSHEPGLPVADLSSVIGRELRRELREFQALRSEDLA
jgi:sialic acid synthase SpsE